MSRLEPYFLLALLGGVLVLSFFILKPFLAPLVLASVFAVIFHPVYIRISKKIGKRPSIAALLTVLICAACIIIPVGFLASRIAIEADQLYISLADGSGRAYLDAALTYGDQVIARFVPGSTGIADAVSANVDSYAKGAATWLIGYLGGLFSKLAELALMLFIFFMALYYLLRDGVALREKLIRLSPLADSDDRSIFTSLSTAVHSVVMGKLAMALIQGVLAGIGFLAFGVPNVVLWASVTCIAALIPGIGTALIVVPAAIFLYVTGHVIAGTGLLAWGLIVVGLIDNLIGPKLIGHGAGLHPLLVLLSVLGGLAFFGPVGIFLGPLSVSLLLALLTIYTNLTKEQTA